MADHRDEVQPDSNWVPGPTLKRPRWLRCRLSIFFFALRHNFIQIAAMVLALLLLIDLILRWDELRPPIEIHLSVAMITGVLQEAFDVLVHSPMFFEMGTVPTQVSPLTWVSWWINVQSLLGGGTLLVALFVWYQKIRGDWMSSLPKRMSVFFLHKGLPVIICRYVWLASEGDLRAWGQQVAAQSVGERFLSFYPNVNAGAPTLAVWIDCGICSHYEIYFDLMDLDEAGKQNLFLREYPGMSRYQNMAAESNTVSTVPMADLKRDVDASVFPFDWPSESVPGRD